MTHLLAVDPALCVYAACHFGRAAVGAAGPDRIAYLVGAAFAFAAFLRSVAW